MKRSISLFTGDLWFDPFIIELDEFMFNYCCLSSSLISAGNLSILAICIGVAAGILLVLLIVFTLVLSSRGSNNAGQRDNSSTTTRCQYTTSSSSDMLKSPSGGVFVGITAEDEEKTTAPNGYNNNILEKSRHELLFPENIEMGVYSSCSGC